MSLPDKNLGIVIISSEMIELIGMCDRVLVMRDGTLQGELSKPELTEENIMRLAVSSDTGKIPNATGVSEDG